MTSQNSVNLIVPENDEPESSITPTNSVWSINQTDANDDINNNNGIGSAFFSVDGHSQNNCKENPDVTLSYEEFSKLQDEALTSDSSPPTPFSADNVGEGHRRKALADVVSSDGLTETRMKNQPEKATCRLQNCDEFSGVGKEVTYSTVGETFQAHPVRKRCSSYMEYSDYEESNGLYVSDGAVSTSFEVSESETESHTDNQDTLTCIKALQGLSKEQIIQDSTAILFQLYEENQSLREQCEKIEKLLQENTDITNQLRYDLSKKDRLLKDLCMELDDKNSEIYPNENSGKVSNCELQERIVKLEDENQAFKTLYDRLQAEKEDWEYQEKNYEKRIQRLQDEVLLNKVDLRRMKEEREKDETNNKKLSETIKNLKNDIRHLTSENHELSENIRTLTCSANRKIEVELRKFRDRCDELEEQLARAKEDQRRLSSSYHDNSQCDSDDSLFSEISQSVQNPSEFPRNFSALRNGNKPVSHPPLESELNSPTQTAQQKDRQNLPKLASLFSGTSILNRVGLLVVGLATLGAGSLVQPTGLAASYCDVGKPGMPGSGDLEEALTRLSLHHVDTVDIQHTAKPPQASPRDCRSPSVTSSTTTIQQNENNYQPSAPLTSSIFRFITSLTKSSGSISADISPTLCLENENCKEKRFNGENSSMFVFTSTTPHGMTSFTYSGMRSLPCLDTRASFGNYLSEGRTRSPLLPGNYSAETSSPTSSESTEQYFSREDFKNDNIPDLNKNNRLSKNKKNTTTNLSDSSDDDVTPLSRSQQTSKHGGSMKRTGYVSVFEVLTSFKQTGKFE